MPPSKRKQGFHELLTALEGIVNQLESEDTTLEASLEAFEKGIALTQAAQKLLTQAEQKVILLTESASGEPEPEEFDSDEGDEDTQ